MSAQIQNAASHLSSDDPFPPLKYRNPVQPLNFHKNKSDNVEFNNNGVVTRHRGPCRPAFVFSADPICLGDTIVVQILCTGPVFKILDCGLISCNPSVLNSDEYLHYENYLSEKIGYREVRKYVYEEHERGDELAITLITDVTVSRSKNGLQADKYKLGKPENQLWAFFNLMGSGMKSVRILITRPPLPKLTPSAPSSTQTDDAGAGLMTNVTNLQATYASSDSQVLSSSPMSAQIQDAACFLSSNDLLPPLKYRSPVIPLKFHRNKSENVEINENGVVTRRDAHYYVSYLFSADPLCIGDTVVVQILCTNRVSDNFDFGLTFCNPLTLNPDKCLYYKNILVDKTGYTVKYYPRELQRGDELALTLNTDGTVYISKNGLPEDVFMVANTLMQLWAFFSLRDDTNSVRILISPPPPPITTHSALPSSTKTDVAGVELMSNIDNSQSTDSLRDRQVIFSSPIPAQIQNADSHLSSDYQIPMTPHSAASSSTQAGDAGARFMSNIDNSQGTNSLRDSQVDFLHFLYDSFPRLKYENPVMPLKFHRNKGIIVEVDDNGVVSRHDGLYHRAYVFSANTIGLGDTIVVQFLCIEVRYVNCFGLGLTSCSPSTLHLNDIPDHVKQLVDCGAYWPMQGNFGRVFQRGDELVITLNIDGTVNISRNGLQVESLMRVDPAQRFWAYFDLYSPAKKVRMLISRSPSPPLKYRNPVIPLKFHGNKSDDVEFNNNGVVTRHRKFRRPAYIFSADPICFGDTIVIQILNTKVLYNGRFTFALTNRTPLTFNPALVPVLMKQLPDCTGYGAVVKHLGGALNVGDELAITFNADGTVSMSKNSSRVELLMRVNPIQRYWAFFDLRGPVKKVRIMISPPQSPISTYSAVPSSTRTIDAGARLMANVVNSQSMNSLRDSQVVSSSPMSAQIQNADPYLSLEDPWSSLKYVIPTTPLRFFRTKGKNVQFNNNNGIVSRSDTEYCQAYVFSAHPVLPGQTIVVQILNKHIDFSGSLAFGLTSCDPSTLRPKELPDDAERLVDRPEYWVVQSNAAHRFQRKDELVITLYKDGRVNTSKNGVQSTTAMHVNHTLRLWAFFDLVGATQKVRILITPPQQSRIVSGSTALCHTYTGPVANVVNAQCLNTPRERHEVSCDPTPAVPPVASTSRVASFEQENQSASECVICFDEPVDSVFNACGHMCTCYVCAVQLWDEGRGKCPICRATIISVIRIYRT